MTQATPLKTKIPKLSLAAFGLPAAAEPITKLVAGQQLSITPTLPYETVLAAIQWSISFILDDRTFISAPLNAIVSEIALVKFWTNLDIDSTLSATLDPSSYYELYDLLTSFGIIDAAKEVVSTKQQTFFFDNLAATLKSLVDYRNSAAGLLESLQKQSKEEKDDLQGALELLNSQGEMDIVQKVLKTIDLEDASLYSHATQSATQSATQTPNPEFAEEPASS